MAPKKRLRTSQACDFCSRRSIRCHASENDKTRCQNCVDFDIPCTYDRPMRRRGQKKQADSDDPEAATPSTQRQRTESQPLPSLDENGRPVLSQSAVAFAQNNKAAIDEYMSTYFQVVYPIFPWIQPRTFWERLARQEHLQNRGFHALVMAACGLAAMRLRDGGAWWKRDACSLTPDSFVTAAKDAIPEDLTVARGTDYIRACATLAVAMVQDGQIRQRVLFLGHYHTLEALEGLSNENLWSCADPVEIEERRCLFWSMYTFEVFTSTVWGGFVKNRESESHVHYPRYIGLNMDLGDPASETEASASWLIGWNMTTDLYRVLEHAIDYHRARRLNTPTLSLYENTPPNAAILDQVNQIYAALDEQFKTFPSIASGDSIFGFQATNIQATLALVRLIIFSSGPNSDLDQMCDVTVELLTAFHQIPIEYMKAMGSLLMHHLAGIGSLLGLAVTGPLTQAAYSLVRSLLQQIVDLLDRMGADTDRHSGISEKIREHIQRIDNIRNGWLGHGSQLATVVPPGSGNVHVKDASMVGAALDPTNQWQVSLDALEWPGLLEWNSPMDFEVLHTVHETYNIKA